MILQLTEGVKKVILSAFEMLKGTSRRLFMASVVIQLGRGGQRLAERELKWNRCVINGCMSFEPVLYAKMLLHPGGVSQWKKLMGGKSRQGEKACDHDFEPEVKLTPFGIFRPDTNQTWLFFSNGSVTADFMVDRLEEIWPALKKR